MSAALILQFLPYLIQAAAAVPQIWDYIRKLREHAATDTAWTDTQRQQFDQRLRDLAANPPPWLQEDAS